VSSKKNWCYECHKPTRGRYGPTYVEQNIHGPKEIYLVFIGFGLLGRIQALIHFVSSNQIERTRFHISFCVKKVISFAYY